MAKKKGKKGGNAAKGEKTFKNLCTVCHSMSSHSTGPAIGGLSGTNIASQDGFSYSSSLQSKATMKWTDGNLDKWLKSPADFAPGNAMAFAGMPNPKDRADLIAFIKSS